jgi:hypothetical protein
MNRRTYKIEDAHYHTGADLTNGGKPMPENGNDKKPNITRREFLREAALAVGGTTLGSITLLSACNTPPPTQTIPGSLTDSVPAVKTVTITQSSPQVTVTVAPTVGKLTVLNPCGFPPPLKQLAMAPPPPTLDGKTIYLVDVTFDNGDMFLDQMKDWFTQNMPRVTAVRRTKKGAYSADDPTLWKEIQAAGGVMVMAIGH